MKSEYKLTEYEMDKMKSISQTNIPVLKFGDYWSGMDKQERANHFWKELAENYGFVWDSVEAAPGKDYYYFLATAKSTEWYDYYKSKRAFDESMEARKPKIEQFTIVDEIGFKKAMSEWGIASSYDAPNKPGYVRANND